MRNSRKIALRLALVAAFALSLFAVGGTVSARSGAHHRHHHQHHGKTALRHIFVIMMENTGNDTLLGNPNAPWINAAVQKYNVAATTTVSPIPVSPTTSLPP